MEGKARNQMGRAGAKPFRGIAFDQAPAPTGHWGWVLILTLVALGLRLFRVDVQSYWADEVESVKLLYDTRHSIGYVLTHNFHGPLHKALVVLWRVFFGDSDNAMRILSALLGTATVPLLYAAARRWAGETSAVWAALLLAVNPFHVWYSQEVRGYVLLMGLGIVMTWAFLKEVRCRDRRSAFLLFSSSLATALASFGGLFLVGAQGCFALVAGWRRGYPIRRFLGIQVVVLLCLTPYLISFGETVEPDRITVLSDLSPEEKLRGEHTFSLLAIGHSLYAYSVGVTLGPSINEMHRSLAFSTFRPHLHLMVAAGLAFGLLAVGGLMGARRRPELLGWLTVWLLVPILLAAALAVLNLKVYNVRYPAVGFAAWVLLIAIGVTHLRPRGLGLAVTAAALALSLTSLYKHYTDTRYWKPDARAAAEVVLREGRAGDRILLYTTLEPFDHYYRRVGQGTLEIRKARGWDLDPERLEAYLDEVSGCDGRLWLVRYRSWYSDPAERCKSELDRRLEHLKSRRFPELPLDLYRCAPGVRAAGTREDQ